MWWKRWVDRPLLPVVIDITNVFVYTILNIIMVFLIIKITSTKRTPLSYVSDFKVCRKLLILPTHKNRDKFLLFWLRVSTSLTCPSSVSTIYSLDKQRFIEVRSLLSRLWVKILVLPMRYSLTNFMPCQSIVITTVNSYKLLRPLISNVVTTPILTIFNKVSFPTFLRKIYIQIFLVTILSQDSLVNRNRCKSN